MIITASARNYTATLDMDTGSVSIKNIEHGVWAGDGVWNGAAITDCAAILGEESDDIYDELDSALAAALGGPDRSKYLGFFYVLQDAVDFEHDALSIGDEFLPACARVVRGGGDATAEYWQWLCGQVDALPEVADHGCGE